MGRNRARPRSTQVRLGDIKEGEAYTRSREELEAAFRGLPADEQVWVHATGALLFSLPRHLSNATARPFPHMHFSTSGGDGCWAWKVAQRTNERTNTEEPHPHLP